MAENPNATTMPTSTVDNPPPASGSGTYRVVHTQVGPWSEGQIFTMDQVRDLYPLADNPQTRAAGMFGSGRNKLTQEDAETAYHSGIIRRLLDLGAIAPAEANAPVTPTPIGPENQTTPPTIHPSGPVPNATTPPPPEQHGQVVQTATAPPATTAPSAAPSPAEPSGRPSRR